MAGHGGDYVASDLNLEELMDEYSSRPPHIAEWLWCIEYVAKFVKDIRCVFDLMNMGYQYSNDYGKRINEVLSLRVLEFMFDDQIKSVSEGFVVNVASTSEASVVEFDLSLSNVDVLREILKEIPVSELRPGMPELSKFNLLPFIAHKKMCLPQCALEKLRDFCLTENQRSAAPSANADGSVFREDRSVPMDTCVEERIGEQQNIDDKDKERSINNEDEPMDTNEKDEVNVINEDTENNQGTANEPCRNGNTNGEAETSSPRPEDARVKCTKDGTWLISCSDDDDDDDESGMARNNRTNYSPWSSGRRTEDVCWKCRKGGTLLICSGSECGSKVHRECLNCEANFDEDGNFHCPVCWYDRVVEEYFDSQKLMRSAKRSLVKFMKLLSTRSKRLQVI